MWTRLEFKVPLTIWTMHMPSVRWATKVSERTKVEYLYKKQGIMPTREVYVRCYRRGPGEKKTNILLQG